MKTATYIIAASQLALLACCLFFGAGATNYVTTTGADDFGNGSVTNPWQTVGHALSASGPGDTIEIGPGEFREFLLITNPVTLNGQNTYSASNPPLSRHNSITELRAPSANAGGRVITVATNNVTIQNLTIYGDPDTNATGEVLGGIYTAHRPITVYNCKIANMYGRGIECRGTKPPPSPADDSSFRSYFAYNLISNISHSSFADGLYLENTQATVEFNEISNVNGLHAHAGIYVAHCDYTDNMSDPLIIRSNFLNDCAQAIWANDPVFAGETLEITGNTITNSLIGIRLSAAGGHALIDWNNIHVTGLSASGLTPARGIWIQGDQDPWSVTSATDHLVYHNTLISEAVTNDGTVGMMFTYDTLPSGGNNNGVRATVLTNYIYNFAIGSMIVSGDIGVSIPTATLVEVEFHYNDIYNFTEAAILTTGFAYMVDATTNFLGYTDPFNSVSTNVNYNGWTYGSLTLDTDSDTLFDYDDLDDDGDGMHDTNEVAIGTSPALQDTDADGMKDPDEYFVAGTDPLDASSVFIMNAFNWTSTNGATFEWPSVTGRTYYVYRTTNLITGFGDPITNYPADTPTNHYTDNTATGTHYFYQISVTN
jgi:hypothetical protein